MKWSAAVKRSTGGTRHTIRRWVDGRTEVEPIAVPTRVEILPESQGFRLQHLDARGIELADTFHFTLEEAMNQAAFEFEISRDEWTSVG